MASSLSALLTRPAAFTASVALHVSAVMAGGHALSEGADDRARFGAPAEIQIEFEERPALPAPTPVPTEQAPLANTVQRASAGHRHSYPLPPSHDVHPHDPSVRHLPGPPPSA